MSTPTDLPPPHSEHELPTYATVREQSSSAASGSGIGATKEHHRSLETSKGRKWMSLFVRSRAPTAASLPIVFEGDTISGRVELDLDKTESSKGVTISIRGGTTFVGQDEDIFLKDEQILWAPPGGKEGKLSGKQSWDFTFKLPTEVSVKSADGKPLGTFALPPSFTERASPAYIDYKIIATLKRGFLRVNQTLVTNFTYQPMTSPSPPSHLRRLAYLEPGGSLVGPDGDPEGWKVIPPVKIKGTLFDTKEVDIDCTLAIATPLSYAIGSPIPFMITLEGQDTQALDSLATPKAIRLGLTRSMATGDEATDDNGVRRTDNHFSQDCGHAYFWPSQEGAAEPHKRVFQGELEVVRTLKPSFKFPKFAIRYTLNLYAFEAAGFVPASQSNILLTEEVIICTKQIAGLRPHSYAPPGYEKPSHVDYNKSVGLLENGNQRFLGHHGSILGG